MEKAFPEKSASFAGRIVMREDHILAGNHSAPNTPRKDSIEIPCKETEKQKELSQAEIVEEVDSFVETLSNVKDTENPPEVPHYVEILINIAESNISNYESGEKFGKNENEDLSFLHLVSCISRVNDKFGEFSSNSTTASSFNRAGSVLHRAIMYLDEEFRALLEEKCSTNVVEQPKETRTQKFLRSQSRRQEGDRCILGDQQESSKDEEFPGYSEESLSTMKNIATAMISSGYQSECCMVYSIVRRNVFRDALNKICNDIICMDDVHKMSWESLEGQIATWIDALKHCSNVLIPGEVKLCETVFCDHPTISRSMIGDIAREVSLKVVNFSQAVVLTKRSAEKLFKFLDMYEALRDFMPKIEKLCTEERAEEIMYEYKAAKKNIAEAAVCMFCDLENSIKNDNNRTPVPSGAVHPLTRYTMNYLKYACEYKDTLEQVFMEYQDIDQTIIDVSSSEKTERSSENDQRSPKKTPFSLQLISIMELLDANLDMKSRLYRDPSLTYIFLMNNGRYILQKIKGSQEIKDVMGENWRRKRSSELRQYHQSYKRETWGRLLQCLSHEGLQSNGKIVKPLLKERFKGFNQMFEEIHRAQCTWVVSDEQLQSELRVSISGILIPAYRSFLGRFKQHLDSGRHADKYIKYQPEDIEQLVDELFDGNATSMGRRRN